MPSIADTKRQVRETLDAGPDHDAILASLQEEIDRHNEETAARKQERSLRKRSRDVDGVEHENRKQRHLKFRFKSGVEEPRRKKREKRRERRSPESEDNVAAAHPFPREPVEPDVAPPSNTAAFRTSLFDALADDEAAQYWESVYSQPIHVYTRPTLQTPTGELESMDDESYAAYVQRKMWEKAHPEVVIERNLKDKNRREEAEAKEKRRREFVRDREREKWRKEGAAKEDGQQRKDRANEYIFDFTDVPANAAGSKQSLAETAEYAEAWKAYLASWASLQSTFEDNSAGPAPERNASHLIPWPTLSHKPAIRSNVEAFMQHMLTSDGEKTKLQLLKVERVRWHPDKVQQRFAGAVDEGTMKVVTGVFQVIDAMLEEERKET